MKFCSWIVLFLFLLTGTLTQDFDLSDALDDLDFDLSDALDDLVPPTPAKPKEQPKPPKQPDGGFGLDLEDVFGPEKPADSPTGGACPRDLDQKLNRIIENQDKLLKLLEQQRPRSSSRFWPTR